MYIRTCLWRMQCSSFVHALGFSNLRANLSCRIVLLFDTNFGATCDAHTSLDAIDWRIFRCLRASFTCAIAASCVSVWYIRTSLVCQLWRVNSGNTFSSSVVEHKIVDRLTCLVCCVLRAILTGMQGSLCDIDFCGRSFLVAFDAILICAPCEE